MGHQVSTKEIMAPIPEPFKWDESFAVFYAQLDEEHKGLFDGIFAVAASPGDAGTLAALKSKVAAHFTYEESQYGKIAGYDVAGHKAKHDEFLKAAGGVNAPVSDDQVVFMKQWLVDHITNSDFTYKGKLEKGKSQNCYNAKCNVQMPKYVLVPKRIGTIK